MWQILSKYNREGNATFSERPTTDYLKGGEGGVSRTGIKGGPNLRSVGINVDRFFLKTNATR